MKTNVYIFIICRSVLFRIKMFQHQYFENYAVYEIIWKIIVIQGVSKRALQL